MNFSVIRYVCGWMLLVVAAFMALPGLVAIYFHEEAGFALLWTILASLAVGGLLIIKKPKNKVFYSSEGYVTVALSWLIISAVGALPFFISGCIPNYIDAFFETVSGFTTTGASILSDVEALPKCMLFWRSLTHWIGGMGVLVFILCLLPMTGGSNMNIMKAESPGPSVSRLVPKVQSTAKILYSIYLALTVIEFLILALSRMPLFDACTITFGTAGTGGFGILNSSIGSYTAFQQGVITVFMLLFGVNFNIYFLIITGKIAQALKSEELRAYAVIVVMAIAMITANSLEMFKNVYEAFHHSAFTVASIITTTGFATVDFDTWPVLSRTILVLLMFIGACAGSTGGGLKVSRMLLLAKTARKEIKHSLHPKIVWKVKMDGKVVEHDVERSLNTYMVIYTMIFVASLLVISVENYDIITNFTAVAATINNIGPGLSLVGPTANYGFYGWLSKLVLCFDMLVGRLEIFPILLLFVPGTWKRF
ncbi:MAG: TrkH family potassium uptake protein [Lachnospiraceae bacterium]|nr:TrkH family potassium uptake protein [Lachnospiraceae bacterium]